MDIESLRDYCLSLPGTSEGIKYGDQLCFMVAGKVFCSSNLRNLDKAAFKAGAEAFEALCDRPGIGPAPYGGATFHWVQVSGFEWLEAQEWRHYLRQAYDLVKMRLPKKIQETLCSNPDDSRRRAYI